MNADTRITNAKLLVGEALSTLREFSDDEMLFPVAHTIGYLEKAEKVLTRLEIK